MSASGGGGGGIPLAGLQSFAATTAATTVIVVPAGQTWSGVVTVNCATTVAAAAVVAGQATGIISTAGAGVVPAAGNYFRVDALAGANAAGGTVGSDAANTGTITLTVTAPAANPVQVQAAATIAGTAGQVNVTAAGLVT